jgi:hypothetical protein
MLEGRFLDEEGSLWLQPEVVLNTRTLVVWQNYQGRDDLVEGHINR